MQSEMFDPDYQTPNMRNEIYDWVESAVFAVVCLILVFTFIGRMVSVDGSSMAPTLSDGDRLISSRLLYTPTYGDIVVVTQPNPRDEPLIKRVIATEGQIVDIDFEEGVVSIDGTPLVEPYTMAPTLSDLDGKFPQTVPAGHVFVMGDNRNDSWDSRAPDVGMIDARYILGRIIVRVTPFDQRGNPDKYWQEEA